MSEQHQESAELLSNRVIQGDYHQLDLHAPAIAQDAQPGQFVHVQIPGMEHRILRRPFSIYDTDAATGRVSVIYKVVGEGTAHLAAATTPGTVFDVLGPLGTPFALPSAGERMVIVAGGYGCAATFLLAKRAARKPVVLIGGRSAGDILLKDAYEALGCDVRIATNDGTCGQKGFVTELLKAVLTSPHAPCPSSAAASCPSSAAASCPASPVNLRLAACGPNPMLKAVAELALPAGVPAQISLDQPMCCGIGACFACVVKVKDASSADGWRYSRSCLEGPVYDARDIYWE